MLPIAVLVFSESLFSYHDPALRGQWQRAPGRFEM